MTFRLCFVLCMGVAFASPPAFADQTPTQPQTKAPATAQAKIQPKIAARGPVTHLPLPRFVSLKAHKANVRRGPSLTHRIDWVFTRRSMPLEVTAEYGHWRRVRDIEGAGGWVHYSLLSGARTVIVEQDMLPLHQRPDAKSAEIAYLELGVVARLGECGPEWCKITSGGYKGWAIKTAIWGVKPDELRD